MRISTPGNDNYSIIQRWLSSHSSQGAEGEKYYLWLQASKRADVKPIPPMAASTGLGLWGGENGEGEKMTKMAKQKLKRKAMKALVVILAAVSFILCLTGITQSCGIDNPATLVVVVVYLGLTSAALFYSAGRS